MSPNPSALVDPEWLRRVTLITGALRKEAANSLLDGLSEPSAQEARAQLQPILEQPRARRQALLIMELGCRRDAAERVRVARAPLPSALGDEVARKSPKFLLSDLPSTPRDLPSLSLRLAARLAREAAF